MTSEEEADDQPTLAIHAEDNGLCIPDISGAPVTAQFLPNTPDNTGGDADPTLSLQMPWQHEDEASEPDEDPPFDPWFAEQASFQGDWEGSVGGHVGGEGPLKLKAGYKSAEQQLQKTILEATRERDNDVLQLCKDDGAFYVQHTFNTDSSRRFKSLNEFTAHMRVAKCTRCGEKYFSSSAGKTALFSSWKEGKHACLSSQITCTRCMVVSCPFCALSMTENTSWIKVHGNMVSWCCTGSRLLLIWVILCKFDEHYCSIEKLPSSSIGLKQKKSGSFFDPKAASSALRSSGVGFDGSPFGVSPFHHHQRHEPSNFDGLSRARKAQIDQDTSGSVFLRLLASLLPGSTRGTDFDYEPPGAIPYMLLKSRVLDYCAGLSRNDSLDDISLRKLVYEDVFTLISSLCTHHTTSWLIYNDRFVRSDGLDLLTLTFNDVPDVPEDESESVSNSLRNLATQSRLLVKRAHDSDFSTREGRSLVSLAKRIDDLWELLAFNDPKRSAPATVAERAAPDLEPETVTDAPDDEIMSTHAFASLAEALEQAPRGRMKRIITDITKLSTGLPPGIWVRYGSDRPDVMKAIIIGPAGTPYENGVFEFDIFCVDNYPNDPPKVQFKTTGDGTASFNPNLYDCGKVCLSLLGTWAGEPWNPAESTLLQVLVSIQAMILCENPYYNEPAREHLRAIGTNEPISKAYNRTIRALTVQYAILAYANRPPALWSDVIQHHFKQNANNILHNMQAWTESEVESQWQASSYRPRRYGFGHEPLASMQKQLQEAMAKFGSTFKLSIIEIATPGERRSSRIGSALAPPMPSVDLEVSPSLDQSNGESSVEYHQNLGSFGPSGGHGTIPSSPSGQGTVNSFAGSGITPHISGPGSGSHAAAFTQSSLSLPSTPGGNTSGTNSHRGRGYFPNRGHARGAAYSRGGRGSGPASSSLLWFPQHQNWVRGRGGSRGHGTSFDTRGGGGRGRGTH